MNALTSWLRGIITKPAERRQWPRREFKASIEVRADRGETWRGVARDISEHGLGAVVYAELRVGDEVLVKYPHPEQSENTGLVARHARVKSRHGWRYGFEFLDDQPLGIVEQL